MSGNSIGNSMNGGNSHTTGNGPGGFGNGKPINMANCPQTSWDVQGISPLAI
jgi:hypothetical protein